MRKWTMALVGAALALVPAAALAAIDNTHHDIPFMGQGTERCARCHSVTGLAAAAPALGKVGNFCVAVCHVGTAAIATPLPDVVPTSPGMFNWAAGVFSPVGGDNSYNILVGHRRSTTTLATIVGGATEATQVPVTGWPYTSITALECTSCHAVHDAENPPFLNAKLSSAGSTPNADNFCARCHNNAIRVQPFDVAGDHPTEIEWNVGLAAGRANAGAGTQKTTDTATVMNGRELIAPAAVAGFNLPLLAPAKTGTAPGAAMTDGVAETGSATTNALIGNAGNHWQLGGHVVNRTTGMPTSGASGTAGSDQFGCYSCHAIHNDVASGTNPKASGRSGDILVVGDTLQTVCFGCHGIEPGVSGYGHPINPEVPVNTTLGWAAVPLTAEYAGVNQPMYRPATLTEAPYCVSCHDVHGGVNGRMAIRSLTSATGGVGGVPNIDLPGEGAVCEMCHAQSYSNPTLANQHHPGVIGPTALYSGAGFPNDTGWVTSDGLGDLDDGLSCGDCHIGDGRLPNGGQKRATAHNWQ